MSEMDETTGLSEVIPGVLHWSAPHPNHGQVVHSHYLTRQRVAIDPIGADGIEAALRDAGGLEQIVLTNRHHIRGGGELAEAFGAAVRAPRVGLHEFEGADAPRVIAYDWNDEVAEGVVAHEVGSLAPDDGALHIAIGPGVLALADAVVLDGTGLGFVPDSLMDDPERTKEGLLASLRRLLDLEWDVLLMAHGAPLPTAGKQALAGFVENPRTAGL